MKKLIVAILTAVLICGMAACAERSDHAGKDPTEFTTSLTFPTGSEEEPTKPGPEPTAPGVSEPNPTDPVQTQPTMPDVGQDPGGFGPIF